MQKPHFTLTAGAHNVVAIYTDGVVCITAFLPYEYFPLPEANVEWLHNFMKAEWQRGFEQMLAYMESETDVIQ